MGRAESSSPNETESQLLSVSKQFDGALAKRNISDLRATLAEGVILHHGECTPHRLSCCPVASRAYHQY